MKIHVNKTRWYLTIVNSILLLLILICLIMFHVISGKLDSIESADRWRGDSDLRFARQTENRGGHPAVPENIGSEATGRITGCIGWNNVVF